MALVTATGSKSADSMVTLAAAEIYLAASTYDTTAWDALTDAEKENLLILAAIAMINMQWTGYPVYENQAMPWPRWTGNEDEFTASTAIFPDNVKKAQAYIAYDVIYRALQNRTSPADGPAGDAIKSISMFGDISLTFENGTEVAPRDGFGIGMLLAQYPTIGLLLSPYITQFGFIGDWGDETPDLLDEVA